MRVHIWGYTVQCALQNVQGAIWEQGSLGRRRPRRPGFLSPRNEGRPRSHP